MELLRSELGAVEAKWRSLKEGLYVRRSNRVPETEFTEWYKAKFHDASQFINAAGKLVNTGLSEAWGPPGQPGVDTEKLGKYALDIG